MKLEESLLRFKKYAKDGGLFYALIRSVKYFIFLLKDRQLRKEQVWREVQEKEEQEKARVAQVRQESQKISLGKLEAVFSGSGLNIVYDKKTVTTLAGLNVGMHSLGLWTDSTKAEWCLLEKERDLFKFMVRFKELCVHQVWTLRLKSEKEMHWSIATGFDEQIYVDEVRYVALTRPCYKSWFWDYHSSDFSRPDEQWRTPCLEEQDAAMVGVRFSVQGEELPSFSIECGEERLLPVIESMPAKSNAHILGFRTKNEQFYSAGSEHEFSATLHFYESEDGIDEKMEFLRQQEMQRPSELLKKKSKAKSGHGPRVLLLNLPWSQGENWGVRAGSRWPHIKDVSEGQYLPFPFFLATAAALLKKNNIPASLIDAIAEKIPEDLFLKTAHDRDAEYWVIETSVPSFHNDMKIIKRLSREGRRIILCGPNIEIYDPGFLEKNKDVDFVLYGEYEKTLLELIQTLQDGGDLSKVAGLIYRNGEKAVKTPRRELCEIDLLPWPDRTTSSMEKYWDLPGDIPSPSVQMLASRGCSFGCNFCLWPQIMYHGNHYRARDVKDVVDEMEYLVREKKFRSVYFDDDTFNIGKERMLRFCGLVKERGLHEVPWAIMARADLMDEEILREMKSAGLWAVKYGVESQDKRFLKDSRKTLDLDKTTEIIKKTKALGIKVHLTFCFGFLGETEESIQKTIQYAIAMDPDSVQFSILTPFPGTVLFGELDRAGRILTKDWDQYDGQQSCVFKPDSLTPESLVKAKNRAYQLWGEHKRRQRGLGGNMRRFMTCLKTQGLSASLRKVHGYLVSGQTAKKLIDEKS